MKKVYSTYRPLSEEGTGGGHGYGCGIINDPIGWYIKEALSLDIKWNNNNGITSSTNKAIIRGGLYSMVQEIKIELLHD